ncbi:NAD(P)-dependent oxidoreductase [Bradyrhizobium sp. BWA-3-5]|uniref:NAD-dependent epimerase/dehydratase family protein n=1 Tax=Bradyrhizobium sp. BWA-3-5 TaxID=3080013 RepID=UPI00293F3F27|nr:NAD(P)-dependent oxidoreductase [Bradyrhizobium sp. BWA-3-5]WOH68588.1 NAD(P)-dependent oxidoreductase [Bradyrhizobium sp. BWA-3-5]
MRILVFGGTGFVGLNIAAALLARGHAVTLFDRAGVPPEAGSDFAVFGNRLTAIQSDVTDNQAVEAVIASGYDAIILGAAITAGPAREASDPETILRVNLLAQTPILIAARTSGVGRIINLSSAAVYGASAFRNALLDEETPCDPASLYAITKFASEKIAARLAGLWQQEIISVRLSAVFGPWERSNDVRDTPSPQAQILAAMQEGRAAVLQRPGVRDWIHAVDVAEAVTLLIEAAKPKHRLYNISTGAEWSALQWGEELAALHPGFVCRLAGAGEVATVDLHSPADRAPLSVVRLAEEFGWRARFGCVDSAADLSRWWTAHGEGA